MSEILENLNPEQKQAVLHEDGPLLIVAGAGTGKTAVVTKRIANLITSQKCKPEEILALTFTEKAAAEMEERVDRLLPYGYVDLWISTFHAFSERILKENGLEIGLSNDFKLLNQTQQWMLVRKNLEKFNLDYYRPLGNPTKFIHGLIHHFSRLKDENITSSDYLAYAEDLKLNTDSAEFVKDLIDPEAKERLTKSELKEMVSQEIKKQTEVAEAYHIYQNLLLENDSLDFGDLITCALKLFQERKNILMKYRKQFKYILVDEFQDTNWAQYGLLKLLAAPKNNITVVADDDQSIFKWRGASISNILNFKNDFSEAKEVFLIKNYRNKQNILDLSYSFIQQNNPYRLEVKLSSENKRFSKKLISQDSGQGEIVHFHACTLEQEAKMVAEKIIGLFNQSSETNWSDFAVLIRANASAEEFMYVFDKAKIPYNFLASRGLYAKNCVLDILSYVRILDDYHESAAVHRILNLPVWRILSSDLINLNYWAKRKGFSLYETMKQVDLFPNIQEKEKIKKVLNLIEKHLILVKEGKNTTEIIQSFLNDSGYLKELISRDSLKNQNDLNYLNQFYQKIASFEKENSDRTLNNFLAFMDLELESGEEGELSYNPEAEGPDTVKIMTVHTAKGLEFKYVFVVNLVDKKFPSISKSDPIEIPEKLVKEIVPEGDVHLQEERRLFYVAMTRAKQGLYFTSADDYGGLRKKKLSRFLAELAENGFELSDVVRKEVELEKPKEKVKEKKIFPTASNFSFTQLMAYINCPYQYRFAHILHVPVKGKPSFSYGKTMHSVLQEFFRLIQNKEESKQEDLFGGKQEIADPTWEDLLALYNSCFIDDWYQTRKERDEYFEKGKKSLKLFFEKWEKEKPRTRDLEYRFNLRIKDKDFFTLKGAIDRIDAVSGGLRLIDYKTGNPKACLSSDDKFQLLIYQMAVEEILKEKVINLTFYYLDNSREIDFLGIGKDLEKTREKIINTVKEIRKGEFPPKPSLLCKHCDFFQICEFRA